jgi:hypothetical protein
MPKLIHSTDNSTRLQHVFEIKFLRFGRRNISGLFPAGAHGITIGGWGGHGEQGAGHLLHVRAAWGDRQHWAKFYALFILCSPMFFPKKSGKKQHVQKSKKGNRQEIRNLHLHVSIYNRAGTGL